MCTSFFHDALLDYNFRDSFLLLYFVIFVIMLYSFLSTSCNMGHVAFVQERLITFSRFSVCFYLSCGSLGCGDRISSSRLTIASTNPPESTKREFRRVIVMMMILKVYATRLIFRPLRRSQRLEHAPTGVPGLLD